MPKTFHNSRPNFSDTLSDPETGYDREYDQPREPLSTRDRWICAAMYLLSWGGMLALLTWGAYWLWKN